MRVSIVTSIVDVPFAILAFTIVPVAPPESVIVVGCWAIPVAPSKKSIADWWITLSPPFVPSEFVPLSAITPSAVSISCNSFAFSFDLSVSESSFKITPSELSPPSRRILSSASLESASVPSRTILWKSPSVPSKIIVLLSPCSSFNRSSPASVCELSVAFKIIVLGSVSSDELVINFVPTPLNLSTTFEDVVSANKVSSRIILSNWRSSPSPPRDTAVSDKRTSPVPSSFVIPSPILVPSLAPYSNCNGGKNESFGDSRTIALPDVSSSPPSRTIYPCCHSSASKTILLPSASTIWSSSSIDRFIPIVVTLTSLPTLKLSSRAIPSLSPVSNVDLTTSSKVVVKTLLVESHTLTIPVWVVRVFAASKVPVTSFKVKFARNSINGAVL